MIVDIKFPYEVNFVRKRHRVPETRYMTGVVPVLIREIAADDAPIAVTMSWRAATKSVGDSDPRAPGMDHKDRVEVRSFDGSFWKPFLMEDYSNRKFHAATPVELEESLTYTSDWRIRDGHADFSGIDVKTINTSDEEQQRVEYASAGDRYVLVDGQPFVRTTEPVYNVTQSTGFFSPHYVWLEAGFLEEKMSPPNVFRADRLTAALVRAEKLRGKPLDDEYLERKGDYLIEVVDASLLTYRDEDLALLHDAKWFADGFDGPECLERAGVEFFKDFVQLRDAIARQDATDIIPALAALMQSSARYDLRNYRRETAEQALERHDRPAELDQDPDLRLLAHA